MAAVIYVAAILSGALIPTVAFLVIALVSLKGTKPAARPDILRALAALHRRRGPRLSRLPAPSGRREVWSRRDKP
jgi:hypothetical protein